MEFEFDEQKSAANQVKHGIDFVLAQALWLDDSLVEVPARTQDEPRLLVVGMIGGRHWSAIVTYPGVKRADHLGSQVQGGGGGSL